MPERSKKYQKVKDYYDSGLWGENRVRQAVVKGWITETEYTMITGQPY